MTDKQLALLLDQIAARLRALADDIEPLMLSGETETKKVMTGGIVTGISFQNEKHPKAYNRIIDFVSELESKAAALIE